MHTVNILALKRHKKAFQNSAVQRFALLRCAKNNHISEIFSYNCLYRTLTGKPAETLSLKSPGRGGGGGERTQTGTCFLTKERNYCSRALGRPGRTCLLLT